MKTKIYKMFVLLLAFSGATIIISGCGSGGSGGSGGSVTPKGSRTLGMDIVDTTSASSFDNNVTLAKSAGAQVMQLHMLWNGFEQSGASGCSATLQDTGGILATYNTVLPPTGLKMNLGILPITTSISGIPADLKPFGDPSYSSANMICRFNKVLDFVHAALPNVTLNSLALGNEIDAYSGASASQFWTDYGGFYVQVVAHARTLWPGVPVTINGTFAGVYGTSSNPYAQGAYQSLHSVSDVVGVNYYPIDSGFSVKIPSVVAGDIAGLLALYPNKPFYFQEVGYQSGSIYTGSSQALQAQFVTAVFQTWDAHASQIPYLAFLRLNDVSHAAAVSTAGAYGLGGNNEFIEYIETLGLRDYTGHDKLGFTQLKSETHARGW